MEEHDDKRPTEAMAVPPQMDEPAPRHGLELGTDVGGYIVDGELGRGGMGVVYAATHPVIGKRAAIKVLKPSLSNNPATVERFTQEARAVNQIGHPNIVDIFAFGALPDGRSYLVMDLLVGESLRQRVKRGALHVREAATVIDEIASALIAAHDKGFAHRDLKPDNIFLVSHPGRFDVKLLDFGLAKLLPVATSTRAYRTATGAQLGTPDYMSPEQLRGDRDGVDHRTDIYALGVVSFEILTGGRPRRFSDGSFDLPAKPSEILEGVPFVPPELAQLVEAMLAAPADERPSLTAVRTVLKRVRPTLPTMPAVEPAPVQAKGSVPSLDSMTPSRVGARPVLPTPPTGSPSLASARPARPSQPPIQPAPIQPPPIQPAPIQPAPVQPAPIQPARVPHPVSQPPAYRTTPPGTTPPGTSPPAATSGLARPAQAHPGTTIGVPPPPMAPKSMPPLAAQPARENRRWLFIAVVLVIAAAIALAIVLAS